MKITILALGALFLAGCGHVATTELAQDHIGGTTMPTETAMDDDSMVHEKDMAVQHIVVEDQMIEDDTVTITGVNSFEDGWIVIYNVVDGKAGSVIGHAPVKKGGDTHISVIIDTAVATPELVAMIHSDKGIISTYEFPGTDTPLSVDGVVVSEKFMTGEDFASVTNDGMMDDEQKNMKEITLADVAAHNTREDCWTVIDGQVADVTSFFGVHPGGDDNLAKACGIDATEIFKSVAKHDPNGYAKLKEFTIGDFAQ